ncbi:hypothetical protein J6590_087603 [Homalodisca vitripennis]|nr:hypothetical protein J6590_087603 [Homalodisca vitripennis]
MPLNRWWGGGRGECCVYRGFFISLLLFEPSDLDSDQLTRGVPSFPVHSGIGWLTLNTINEHETDEPVWDGKGEIEVITNST